MCQEAGRPRPPRPSVAGRVTATALLAVLAGGGYLVWHAFAPVIAPVLTGSGCVATGDHQSILLDTEQGAIAATIAGVAHPRAMPRLAVTVAYATAMQESKLHNLNYGDLDSVGVFQQRPSEGWGPRPGPGGPDVRQHQVLPRAQGHARLPADARLPGRAGRAAQRGRGGLRPVPEMAAAMSPAFTGQRGHAVCCWSGPASRAPADVPGSPAGSAARSARRGPRGHRAAGQPGSAADGTSTRLRVRVGPRRFGWEVARWLVTHASTYRISEIRYGGYQWRAAASSQGWVRDSGAPPTSSLS